MSKKPAERILELRSLNHNKFCCDCNARGANYAIFGKGFASFVCTRCSGPHRDFGHRAKNVTASTFTKEEIAQMEEQGNAWVNAQWLAKLNDKSQLPNDETPLNKVKDFLVAKYTDKRWYHQAKHAPAAGATASTANNSQTHEQQSPAMPAATQPRKDSAATPKAIDFFSFGDAPAATPTPPAAAANNAQLDFFGGGGVSAPAQASQQHQPRPASGSFAPVNPPAVAAPSGGTDWMSALSAPPAQTMPVRKESWGAPMPQQQQQQQFMQQMQMPPQQQAMFGMPGMAPANAQQMYMQQPPPQQAMFGGAMPQSAPGGNMAHMYAAGAQPGMFGAQMPPQQQQQQQQHQMYAQQQAPQVQPFGAPQQQMYGGAAPAMFAAQAMPQQQQPQAGMFGAPHAQQGAFGASAFAQAPPAASAPLPSLNGLFGGEPAHNSNGWGAPLSPAPAASGGAFGGSALQPTPLTPAAVAAATTPTKPAAPDMFAALSPLAKPEVPAADKKPSVPLAQMKMQSLLQAQAAQAGLGGQQAPPADNSNWGF